MKYILLFTILILSCSEFQSVQVSLKDSAQLKPVKKKKPVIKNTFTLPPKDPKINWSQEKIPKNTKKVSKFCKKVDKYFYKMGWGPSRCKHFSWHHVRNSVKGDPLMWVVFGDEKGHQLKRKNTTLLMCGVHGDEITPNKFCLDAIYHVKRFEYLYHDKLIVIVPFVSPDSFFKRRRTRTNHRGVDLNRNFPTKDWNKNALRLWKTKYRKDKRRFPGKRSLSEPETLFQVNLIKRYKPNKIISVHAPLTILDYDGPKKAIKGDKIGPQAKNLLVQMSKRANGYQIKDYPFYPGSLGNWAGNERGIPTYTLELPSSDNRKHREFWNLFRNAIHTAILKDFRSKKEVKVTNNTSKKK
ncbi:MAG: hypothetical protein DRQ88_11825 [Epsilonproteobacteria bacterium]|nr:MAG: hypothetical protein DRQ89_09705 [Campylobacterota bacterium]RLA63875.1 MAG: hypothetical protein DRQ88_11825 [Campylobacterota bacterium]